MPFWDTREVNKLSQSLSYQLYLKGVKDKVISIWGVTGEESSMDKKVKINDGLEFWEY